MNIEKLKFPIGKYQASPEITPKILATCITDIESFPSRLKSEVVHLSDTQLDTPYRPEGWTIRQVVHHCADSHANALIRFKLAMTEDTPTIKPYYEDRWAELADSKTMPLEPSLKLLEGLHIRWTIILKSLNESDLKKTFIHPEHGKSFRLDENTGIYAWHCNHHLAHITTLKERKDWR